MYIAVHHSIRSFSALKYKHEYKNLVAFQFGWVDCCSNLISALQNLDTDK